MSELLDTLYNVAGEEYDLGSKKDFYNSISNPQARKALWDTIGTTYDLGEWDDFNGKVENELRNEENWLVRQFKSIGKKLGDFGESMVNTGKSTASGLAHSLVTTAENFGTVGVGGMGAYGGGMAIPITQRQVEANAERAQQILEKANSSYEERLQAAERIKNGTATERDRNIGSGVLLAEELKDAQQAYDTAARGDIGDATFTDLIHEHRYGDALKLGLITAIESSPQMAMGGSLGGRIALGVLSASDEYDRLNREHPDMSNAAKISQSVLVGTIEQFFESRFNPFKLGGKMATGGGAITKQIQDWAKKGWKAKGKDLLKSAGLWLKEAVGEGTEEVATSFYTDVAKTIIDRIDGNGEGWDKAMEDYKQEVEANGGKFSADQFWEDVGKGLLNDFIGGAMAGGYMGGATVGVNNAVDYLGKRIKTTKAERDAMRKQADWMNNIIGDIAEEEGLTRKEVLAQLDEEFERKQKEELENGEVTGYYGYLDKLNKGISSYYFGETFDKWVKDKNGDVSVKAPIYKDGETNSYVFYFKNPVFNDDGSIDYSKSTPSVGIPKIDENGRYVLDRKYKPVVELLGAEEANPILEAFNEELRRNKDKKITFKLSTASVSPSSVNKDVKPSATTKIEPKTFAVTVNGNTYNVTVKGRGVINEDGTIDFEKNKNVYLVDQNGKPIFENKEEVRKAVNEELKKQKESETVENQVRDGINAEGQPEAAPVPEATPEVAPETLTPEQAAADEQMAQMNAEEQRINDMNLRLEQQLQEKGDAVMDRWTPEEQFVYTMMHTGLDAAIEDARGALEDAATLKNRTRRRAVMQQWQALIDQYTPKEAAPEAPAQPEAPAPEPQVQQEPVPAQETPTPEPQPAPVEPEPAQEEPAAPDMNLLADDVVLIYRDGGNYKLARETEDGKFVTLDGKPLRGKWEKIKKRVVYRFENGQPVPYILRTFASDEELLKSSNGYDRNGNAVLYNPTTGEEVKIPRSELQLMKEDGTFTPLWQNPMERQRFAELKRTAKMLDDLLNYVVYSYTNTKGERIELKLQDILRYSSQVDANNHRVAKDKLIGEMVRKILRDMGRDVENVTGGMPEGEGGNLDVQVSDDYRNVQRDIVTKIKDAIYVWNKMDGVAPEDKLKDNYLDLAKNIKQWAKLVDKLAGKDAVQKTEETEIPKESQRPLTEQEKQEALEQQQLFDAARQEEQEAAQAARQAEQQRLAAQKATEAEGLNEAQKKIADEFEPKNGEWSARELAEAASREGLNPEQAAALGQFLGRRTISPETMSRLMGIEYSVNPEVQLNKQAGERAVEILRNAGVKVNIITEEDLPYLIGDKKVQELRSSNGVVYGFSDGQQIWLLDERMNANTPVHEYGHLWVNSYAQQFQKEWAKAVELLKQTQMWQDVLNDEQYAAIHDNEQEMASEVMSRLLGDWYSQTGMFGDTRLEDSIEKTGLRAKIESFIRKMLQKVADWWNYDVGTPRNKNFNSNVRELLSKPINDIVKNIENNLVDSKNNAIFATINITQNASGRLGEQDKRDFEAYNAARNTLANPNATQEEQAEAQKTLDEIYERKQQQADNICKAIIDALGDDNASHINVRRGAGSWMGGGEYTFIFDVNAATEAERLRIMDALTYAAEEMKQDMFIESENITEDEYTDEGLLNGEQVPNMVFKFDSPLTETDKSRLMAVISQYSTEELPLDCTVTDDSIIFAFPSFLLEYGENEDTASRIQKYTEFYNKWHNQLKNIFKNGDIRKLYPSSQSETRRRTWTHFADESNGNERRYSQDRDTLRERTNGTEDARVLSEAEAEKIRHAVRNILGLEQTLDRGTDEVSREMLEIKQQAQADGTFMKAPNGADTNLTEKQWLQTRTQAFKDWFGDWQNGEGSVVLDENGEPKVVYRGSKNANSYIFHSRYDTGAVWFTDNRAVAEHYARRAADHELTQDELDERVQPVFLNIRDAAAYDAQGKTWTDMDAAPVYLVENNEGENMTFRTREEAEQYCAENGLDPEDIYETNASGDVAEADIKEGKDGVIFENLIDGTEADNSDIPSTIYVTSSNTQAKSATENVGTFDEENPDIRFMIGSPDPSDINEKTRKRMERNMQRYQNNNPNVNTTPSERLSGTARVIYENEDNTFGLYLLQKKINLWRKEHGRDDIPDSMDVRSLLIRCSSAIESRFKIFNQRERKTLEDVRDDIVKKLKKQKEFLRRYAVDNLVEEDAKGNQFQYEPTPEDLLERYLIARDNVERAELKEQGWDIDTRGERKFDQRMGVDMYNYAREFESLFGGENSAEIKSLWNAVHGCTDLSLRALLEGGRINEELYDRLLERQFYVPEKDFAESNTNQDLAEQREQQARNKRKGGRRNPTASAVQFKAEGGESMAANVFENIVHDVQNSISVGEVNKVRMAMFDLMNDNQDYVEEYGIPRPKQEWYVKVGEQQDGTPIYEATLEKPSEDLIEEAKETNEIIKQMNDIVKELRTEIKSYEKGTPEYEALKERIKNANDYIAELRKTLPVVTGSTARNVTKLADPRTDVPKVSVYIDGIKYDMTFDGMREVADALNGEYDLRGLMEGVKKFNAAVASAFTTYNPTFFAVNIARDVPYILAKGTSEYGWEFAGRFAKALTADGVATRKPIIDYLAGRLDENTPEGQMFYNFIMGGGNTGYSQIQDIRQIREDFNKTGFSHTWAGQAMEISAKLNEYSELLTRYAAYKAMIESGYSENEALNAAKNLSTNFNIRGAGNKFINFFNSMSMFSNAAIQGASGFFKTFSTPASAARAFALMCIGPAFLGFLNTVLCPDDDDKEKKVSDYYRDNYFVFGPIKIPLTQELRPFWRIGVNAAMRMQGRRTAGEIADSIISGFTEYLMPLPPAINEAVTGLVHGIEQDGIVTGIIKGTASGVTNFIIPQYADGVKELISNKDFMGNEIRKDYQWSDTPQYQMNPNEALFFRDMAKGFYWISGGWRNSSPSKYKRDPYSDIGERVGIDVSPKELRLMAGTICSTGLLQFVCQAYGLTVGGARALWNWDADELTSRVRARDWWLYGTFVRPEEKSMYRYSIYKEIKKMSHDYEVEINGFDDAISKADGEEKAKLIAEKNAWIAAQKKRGFDKSEVDRMIADYNRTNAYSKAKKQGIDIKKVEKEHPDWEEVQKRSVQAMNEVLIQYNGLERQLTNTEKLFGHKLPDSQIGYYKKK